MEPGPEYMLFANLVSVSETVLNPIRCSKYRIVCINERISTS